MCRLTSLVISNIVTCFLPPKTTFRLSSALIMVLFFLSWSPLRLMYAQSFLVTWVRGSGLLPTTAARALSGCTGFMNAAFGLRFFTAIVSSLEWIICCMGIYQRPIYFASFFLVPLPEPPGGAFVQGELPILHFHDYPVIQSCPLDGEI